MADREGEARDRAKRNRVPDLPGDFHLGSAKPEVVGKRLDPGGLPVGDGPMLSRIKAAALPGLEELGADGTRGPIPPQPSEKIGPPGFLSNPAGGGQVKGPALKVEPFHAFFGYRPVSTKAELGGISAEMQVRRGGSSRMRTFTGRGRSPTASLTVLHGAGFGTYSDCFGSPSAGLKWVLGGGKNGAGSPMRLPTMKALHRAWGTP